MADDGTKPTTNKFAANDQANYYSGITSIKVNRKNAYELKDNFLDDLRNNAFSETNGEDAVEHIEYFLRIVDPIDLPNVNQDKLRVLVSPISLVGDTWKWFDEIKGSINRALWDYWKTGSDETEPMNEKFPNLKKEYGEALELKAICVESWGDAKQSVINFFGWLKKTFRNFHKLDYELLEKLQYYWWKVNKHECSPFANWINYIRGPYANYYSNSLEVMKYEDEERCEVFDDHERPIS
nr:hypothetical protein [Tanacetum cinerariifolium]